MRDPRHRQLASQMARAKLARNPIYLDTETTGLNDDAQIVEICVLDTDGSVLVDSLVRPTTRIPYDAIRIHGITDILVEGAPSWAELWPTVAQALAGRTLAIYNAEFDLRLMQQSHARHGLAWPVPLDYFCVMELYAQYRGDWRYDAYRRHSLSAARLQCGLALPNAHRARADALLARDVLHFMAAHG